MVNKFKVGDRVRMKKDGCNGISSGELVYILEDSRVPYVSRTKDGKQICAISENNADLVEPAKPKFKIGDRVKTNSWGLGVITLVDSNDDERPYLIKYDAGIELWGESASAQLIVGTEDEKDSGECIAKEEINKTKPKTFMKTVSNMMKKLLDSNTQLLVKAGLINGDLELTCEGKNELTTILFMANKDAMVARAQEIITEAEAKKE